MPASRAHQLVGVALDYLIGAEGPLTGAEDRITETPFGERPAALGQSIAYCNLRREDGEPDAYGPYLPHDDIFREYGEGRPDPEGSGFRRNLIEQLDHCKRLGHTLVEEDNPDSYSLSAVLLGISLAESNGLGVIAKNPKLVGNGAVEYVRHPNVFGIIVEKDAGTADDLDRIRRAAGKPELPVWFVHFDDGRPDALERKDEIIARGYLNMGVTFSAHGEYGSSEDVLRPRAPPASIPATAPAPPAQVSHMSDSKPPWLATMQQITGVVERPEDADNPTILGWANGIGEQYPEMREYCRNYKHDSIPWCGLTVAHCMAVNGIRPPYNPGDDLGSFLWVDSWANWGTPVTRPQPGDVLVFSSPHHVTLYEGEDGNAYLCRGGNQSDAVNVTRFAKSGLRTARRPAGAAPIGQSLRPELRFGSMGEAVTQLQTLLGGIEVDGEFGPQTEAAVRMFQAQRGLEANGVVNERTWELLLAGGGSSGTVSNDLSAATANTIAALAGASSIARYEWRGNRGVAPAGYIKGMAVAFARALLKLKAGDSAARTMAAPVSGDSSRDALAHYDAEFRALGMSNAEGGATTLRHLFVLMLGLGMRESSGRYCEGRDRSAGNVSADNAEAGLFQQSWDSRGASSELPRLLSVYSARPDGFISIFQQGVSPKSSDLENYGSGDGAAFQALCKSCPDFAVEAAAVGLRTIRTHWGPINRKEAELRPEADTLFAQVQQIVEAAPPIHIPIPVPLPPEPVPVPPIPVPPIPLPAQDPVAAALAQLIALFRERLMSMQPMWPAPVPQPVPPPISIPVATPVPTSPMDTASLLQQALLLLRSMSGQPPGAATPTAAQQAEQLRKIVELVTGIISPPTGKTLGPVNSALGETIGNLLNGKKSAIGIIGALATAILEQTGPEMPLSKVIPLVTSTAGLGSVAMPIFLAITAWGALGKMEKWTQGGAWPPKPPQ